LFIRNVHATLKKVQFLTEKEKVIWIWSKSKRL